MTTQLVYDRKARLYYDPPGLAEKQKRQSVTIWDMPLGTRRTEDDVIKTGGDPRDWFKVGWRLEAYYRNWAHVL